MDRRQFLTSSGLTALAAGMPAAGLSFASGREPADYQDARKAPAFMPYMDAPNLEMDSATARRLDAAGAV